MSIYQCEQCGCAENTSLGWYPRGKPDWAKVDPRRLCSACAPLKFADGSSTGEYGKWHGEFPRRFFAKGKYTTDRQGNLAHKDTGEPANYDTAKTQEIN